MAAPRGDRAHMSLYRFDQIAENINVRVMPGDTALDRYIGLEHLDPESLKLRRWGSPDDVIGQKLHFWKGDIIYGKRRAYQRKLAVADFEGICSAHAIVLRAKPDICLPEFLPFFMQSETFHQRALEISVGSLSPTINWSALARQDFPLPSLDEQRRIADLLWAADDDICRTQDLHVATQNLKKVVFNNLLTSGNLENQQIVFPEAWNVMTIGHLGNIVTGTTPSTSNREYYGDEFMFVSPADISEEMYVFKTEKHISKSGLDVSRKLPKNSVMVVCIGSTIGKVALTTKECTTNQQINSIICNKDNDSKFTYYLMKFLERNIKSFAGATAVPILNKQDFSKIQVKVPPLSDQMKIVSIIDRFEKVLIANKAKLEDSQKLKKQLLVSSLGG